MPAVILDACGVLNLYASGRFVPILAALGHDWRIPVAVERESRFYRQPSPDDPETLIVAPIDLSPALDLGLVIRCDCESDAEQALYLELAATIRDDGESMGLAIAKSRGWSVLTDDRKARRIARELGVVTLATGEVLHEWSEIAKPSPAELAAILSAIERFANFRPNRGAEEYDWWMASLNGN